MMCELILDILLLYLTTDNGLLFFVLLNVTVWIYNVGVLFIIITIPFLIVTLFVLCFFVTCLVTIGHRCYLHPYHNYDQFYI
jgi:hypothetical protein